MFVDVELYWKYFNELLLFSFLFLALLKSILMASIYVRQN